MKFCTNPWVTSPRSLSVCVMFSTWINKWLLFGLPVLHYNTLTTLLLHGPPWKSEAVYLETSFIQFELQKGISLGQSTSLSTCFIRYIVYLNQNYCCFNLYFLSPSVMLNFIFLTYFYYDLKSMSCYQCRQPVNTGICSSSTCKITSRALILSFKHSSNSNPCARSYFA